MFTGVSTAAGAAPLSRINTTRAVVLALAAVTLFRLWCATCLELVPDEAYYWLWSKHLAASYRDKGPAIAWTIAFGRLLFGDTVFGIRVMGVLLGTGTAWQLFRLAQRLYDDRVAIWCLIIGLIIPLFAIGSILMTIDSLSVFFWAWAANLFWVGLETGRVRYWLLLGFAIGLGFLAKFTNGVQLACLGLFLLWSRPHRHFLLSRQSLATLFAFGVCALPILWWNVQTGWIHAMALQDRSGMEGSFHIRPGEVFRYLGGQLAVASPLLTIGMVIAAFALWRTHGTEDRVKHLLTQYVPLQALFLFFSLNKMGEANWTAPSLVAGIVLLVVFWRDIFERKPRWRRAIWGAVGIALAMTLAIHVMPFLHLPRNINPLRRAEGWPDFAQHMERARERYRADLLFANHYNYASLMTFYMSDHPVTYLPPEPYGSSQFSLWPAFEVRPGTRALYVTDDLWPPQVPLNSRFSRYRLVEDFWSEKHGQPVYHFRTYLLEKD
jgi:4-amino-4-deoxy-L-arabinose transferase-like glycosyltransferase